jgi:proline iminopeptidase
MKKLLTICLLVLVTLCTFTTTHAQQKSFYFTTSDSVTLFVRIAGSGQPCLFVHGGPGSWTKYYYALGGDISEQDMTMIYVDQRGCGRSGGDEKTDYSLARVVKDYEELRAYLGYQQWLLMPHSFGGIIATEYAYKHPRQVAGLIYVTSTLNLTAARQSYIEHGARILDVPAGDFLKPGVSATEAWGQVISELNAKDLMYQMMYSSKEGFEQMNAVMDTTLNWQFGSKVWSYPEYEQDFTQKTASIKAPVLVFSGAYDYAVGTEHYKSFKFPKATYKILRTGHCPYQEQPETFQQHIQTYLGSLKYKPRRS